VLHNSTPPDSRQATRHTSSPAPNRSTHARAATAIASNASATPLPAGITGPSSGSSTTAHRVKYPWPGQPATRIGAASHAPQHPPTRKPPRPQPPPTRRTHQRPAPQLSLDPLLPGAYDQHRVPPPASRRALPTATKQTGGLSRLQNAPKPANSTNAITTTNSTSSPARAQTQQRSTGPTSGAENARGGMNGHRGARPHRSLLEGAQGIEATPASGAVAAGWPPLQASGGVGFVSFPVCGGRLGWRPSNLLAGCRPSGSIHVCDGPAHTPKQEKTVRD
jgi:hypothetical protein